MISGFGPVRQVGYVVRDIEAAMHDWASRLRIGPWFYNPNLALAFYRFRGVDYPRFDMSYALANSGDLQIELIQQRCETPSLYREHLAGHGEGVQHLGCWPDDYDAAFSNAVEARLSPAQEGGFGAVRFVYFENAAHGGTCLELSEMTPARRETIARIRRAALNWDGADPVRSYAP